MLKGFIYVKLLLNFLFLVCFQGNFNVNTPEKKVAKNKQVSIWSDQERNKVQETVKVLINAFKTKDMKSISNQISYPIKLSDVNGKVVEFVNKESFLMSGFDELFNENFVNTIVNSDELFSNWRGFMLGDGANTIWISPDENGKVLIYSIFTDHLVSDSISNSPISLTENNSNDKSV